MLFDKENGIDESIVDNLIFESFERLENKYKQSNLIINPIAIQKCLKLQTVIKKLSCLSFFEDVEFKEKINKQFGWSYIVSIKGAALGYTGTELELFKKAVENCDSIDINEYTVNNETIGTQITLAINELYIPIQ